MVDTYEAKFDYERERDDVLSFHKGDHFEIVNKANDKWWVAKRLSDGTVGYVPCVYLQPSNHRVIGKLVPEKRRNTREHDIHLQALAELHRKVKPLPAEPIQPIIRVRPAIVTQTGPFTRVVRPTPFTPSYVMWEKHMKAHVIGAALGIPIPSSDEEEEDLPTHQRKTAPAAVPTFLKVFNPAEVQPQRKSFSGRGSVTPEPPSPTQKHGRSKSWRGESTATTTPSLSSASSQPFLRSPSAEYKAPPGVFKKPPPVAAPKKPPVSPLSTFEFKPPPPKRDANTVITNNNTSNGTPYHHQCVASLLPQIDYDDDIDDVPLPPPPNSVAPPEPDYDQAEDEEEEIPYHHRLNSSGRISSLSSEESNDLPSPQSPHGKSPLDLQHPSDEERLIHPKPLHNPVKSSKNHQQLHRDLKMSINKHGPGKVPIGHKPELTKIFQERKRHEMQKEMDKEKEKRRTSIEVKLMERLKMEEEKSKQNDTSLQQVNEKPEFMKVRLKHHAPTHT